MTHQTKTYRKFVATAATATLVASAVAPAASFAAEDVKVTDIDGHRHQEAIETLVAEGVIQGFPDNTFRPDATISRGSAAIMIARSLDLLDGKDIPDNPFTDVGEKDQAYEAIVKLADKGIVSGFTKTQYKPDETVTRGQMAKIIAEAFELELGTGDDTPFSDVTSKVSTGKYISAIFKVGITEGYPNGKFGTQDGMKRGDFAQMTYKAMVNAGLIDEDPGVVDELVVESVSAITTTGVEVTFPEITEAIEDANVVVVDGEGNVVPTEAKLLAEGEKSAEFAFTTPFDVDHEFTGVWTVNGIEYNFDAINQLEDIRSAVEAGNQIKLQEALDAAGIQYANETRIASYLVALQEGATESLESVQEAITKVDEKAATEADKEATIKAVEEAKTQAQLLSALQSNFQHVNPEWIVNYANNKDAGDANLLAFTPTDDVDADYDTIQEAIYTTNFTKVTPKVEEANMSLDSKKVAEARTLVTKWIPAGEEDEVTTKDWALDGLDLEDALIAVNNARTNSALKSALTSLDNLENTLVEKYKNVKSIEGVAEDKLAAVKEDKFDLDTVKDANLTAYRNAIAAIEGVEGKNQRSDIQTIITKANEKAIADAKVEVLKNINEVDAKTSATDVVALLQKSQELHEQTNKVNNAYAEAYKTALVEKTTATEPVVLDAAGVNTLVGNVNVAEDAKALLAAVNSASTASEMSKALIALEAANDKTDFTNLSSTAKLEVAEIVLAKRNSETDKKFDDKNAVLAAVKAGEVGSETGAIAERTAFLKAVNEADSIAKMRTVLAGKGSLVPEFADLGTVAQTEKAEAVYNQLQELKDQEPASEFQTITSIRTAAGL